MTTPHPLPAEGGSYIRHPDGSLERLDHPDAEAPPAPVLAEEAPPALAEKAPKTSVKGT